jgi:CheY-like chemotaxis protein
LKSGDGTVKIADFGVSFIGKANKQNSNKRIVGTPAFIAPEMLGEDGYDPFAADIWSLGICIFHMATARLPFIGRTIFQIIAMAKRQGLQFPEKPELSAELKDLLTIVLQIQPENRASIEDVMTHAWTTKNGTDPLPPSLKQSDMLTVTEKEIADAVRKDPLAALLRPNFKTEEFKTGDVIMRKGEIGETLYFINAGECEVLVDALHDEIAEQASDTTSQDEAQHLGVLAVRGEGVVVGEIAVLETILRMQVDGDTDYHGKRTASVRARGNVECLSVTVEELFAALEQDEEGKDRLFRTANDRLEQNTEVLLQIAESKKDSLHPVIDSFSPKRKIQVLYAEDSVPTQFIVKRLVNRIHDIELVCVNDGKAALDYCVNAKNENVRPDIILMDCQMPVMDGLEATREIRKLDDPIVSKVPIVAVSSGIKSMNERDCMEAGMDDYVAKPLNQQILTGVLSRNIPTSLMKNAVDPNDVKLMQELMISDEMV